MYAIAYEKLIIASHENQLTGSDMIQNHLNMIGLWVNGKQVENLNKRI